jgi:hypothetical protein
MMRHKCADPCKDLKLLAASTLEDVVRLSRAARQALGKARLATVTKSAEFMRVIFGDETTEVAAGGGYYCQTCGTQPKYDYQWTKAKCCGRLSGWFCAYCGHAYDLSRMSGLITFAVKSDPNASFVINTKMPGGTVANILSAIKVVNLIRMGEFPVTKEDVERADGLGNAIKTMIASDNDRYCRLFDQLREVQKEAILRKPNIEGLNLPAFQICESTNDVTLTSSDFGRGCVVYDVGKLFDITDTANPTSEAWRGVVQTVLAAWGMAEAGVMHTDLLNKWTSCSKKVLKKLRDWTYIRSTGRYPPEGDGEGRPATDADKEWASRKFEDF